MRAFIKQEKWDLFQDINHKYGFSLGFRPKTYYTKVINSDILLVVHKKTREMLLLTPMGGSPFMELHKECYQDLYDDGFIEYIESRFD